MNHRPTKAKDLQVGDIILLPTGKVRIMHIALVRGIEIQIKHRPADMMDRTTIEKTDTFGKYETVIRETK